MLLNLSKIRTAHERYEKVYGIEAFAGDQDVFRVVQPVALAFDIDKDKGHFRLVGQVRNDTGTRLQPVSRTLHDGSRALVRSALPAPHGEYRRKANAKSKKTTLRRRSTRTRR